MKAEQWMKEAAKEIVLKDAFSLEDDAKIIAKHYTGRVAASSKEAKTEAKTHDWRIGESGVIPVRVVNFDSAHRVMVLPEKVGLAHEDDYIHVKREHLERVGAEATPSPATSSSDMKMEKACARKWLEVNSAGLDSERQFEAAVDALALHIFHYIVGWDDEVPTLREQENFRVEAEHRGAEVVYAPSPATKETRSELFTVEREDGEWVGSNEADYSCYLSRSEAEEALSDDADNREVSEALYKIIRFTRSAPSPAREKTPAMETLTHTRSCSALTPGEDCTCALDFRIALQTEQTMHAAWRKRAEEAEARERRAYDAGARSVVVAPQTRPDKGYLIAADELVASRTSWLKQHGVPISTEFVRFAEAIGDAVEMLQDAAKLAGVAALQTQTEVNRLRETAARFYANRGYHTGPHDFSSGACRRCEEAYIAAEAEFDTAFGLSGTRDEVLAGVAALPSTPNSSDTGENS